MTIKRELPRTARYSDAMIAKMTGEQDLVIGYCGLFCRINKGSKVWVWRGRVRGVSVKRKIGIFPEMSLADAKVLASTMVRDIEREPFKVTLPKRKQPKTVADTVSDYLDNCTHLESVGDMRSRFRLYVLPIIGHIEINKLLRRDIVAMLDKIEAAHGKRVTLNRILAHVRSWLTWCLDRDLIDNYPAHGIKLRVKEKPRKREIAFWEMPFVLAAIDEIENWRNPVMLLLHTMCRRSDITHLTWGEVLETSKGTTLVIGKNKSGVSHRVWLTPQALKFLPDRPIAALDPDLVFPSLPAARGPFLLRTMRSLTDDYAAAANKTVAHFTLHDFRSTAISWFSGEDCEDFKLSDRAADMLLAHTPKGITNGNYNAGESMKERREALTLWSNYLSGIKVATIKKSELFDIAA